MRKALAVAAIAAALALPHPALADETASEANASAVLSALDALTTSQNLAHGWHEDNPIARPFVRTTAGTVLYFAASAALVNVTARLLHRRSPNLARGYLAANAAFEATLVARNVTLRNATNYRP